MISRIGNTFGRGLTLIEVLISVVILSTGAVLVVQALARAAYAQAVVERQTAAYLFAMSKMAGLELAIDEGQELKDREAGSFRVENQLFQWETTAEPSRDDPELTTVALHVRWRYGPQTFEQRLETWMGVPLPESP